jgi:NTE family protein
MSDVSIPKSQRALVMQGGGSLGAYESGVFKALYEELPHRDNEKISGQADENIPLLFDILAGTSIGAINAAILVNHVVKHRSWKGSWEILNNFWKDVSTMSGVEMDPTFSYRWKYYRYFSPDIATPETARRYYSAKEFLAYGARNVFTSPKIISDKKFFDYLNSWYAYDNTPLRRLLEDKYLDRFPLKTTNKEQQPRLLLVCVDVQEAATVTFDSYCLKSEYGTYDKQSKTYEHTIKYPEGVSVDHVLASASVPISYDYTVISDTHNTRRRFWDGILLSNTPLRELIGQHKTFWEEEISEHNLLEGMWESSYENSQEGIRNNTKKVPDLDIFIVNLWPSKEQKIPYDYDGQVDRRNDILYHDKTEYDQKVALLVSDYIDLAKQIRNIAFNHIDSNKENAFQKDLEKFLGTYSKSKFRTGEQRRYVDLLKGRFDVNNVIRIERQDDPHTISNKWADFSSGTIKEMITNGYSQALDQLKQL